MLLGEYDYGDTYADSTWPAKLLFVIFVIDMSVVLMNLVIGLAVNDVDSIQRQSRMMRMLSESNMVAFLEEVRNRKHDIRVDFGNVDALMIDDAVFRFLGSRDRERDSAVVYSCSIQLAEWG